MVESVGAVTKRAVRAVVPVSDHSISGCSTFPFGVVQPAKKKPGAGLASRVTGWVRK